MNNPDQDKCDLLAAIGVYPKEHQLEGFAAACYKRNNFDDLVSYLDLSEANAEDCKEWDIMPYQWRAGVLSAIEHSMWVFTQTQKE